MSPFFRRFERVIRYIVVGGGVTLFYTLVTVALISGHVIADPTAASVVASLITLPLSFLAHRRFTYVDATRERGQWERFAVVAASNFLINVGLMKGVDTWQWPYWTALALGWVVVPILNYTINAVWVFRINSLLSIRRYDETP
ncbi:MAG: hypothetical protein GC190_12580 [Alphaproteobacteria bacterium]|nr:hypothetical protein [Alphaproteobacteria bacterium]